MLFPYSWLDFSQSAIPRVYHPAIDSPSVLLSNPPPPPTPFTVALEPPPFWNKKPHCTGRVAPEGITTPNAAPTVGSQTLPACPSVKIIRIEMKVRMERLWNYNDGQTEI